MNEWDDWFCKQVTRAGGLFKLVYDEWVYGAPTYISIFRLLPPQKKVLEIGCGFGGSAAILSLLGYDVTAIDIDPKMLSHSRTVLTALGVAESSVKLELGDLFDLSSYYRRFDVTFSSGVLEHFPPEEAITAMREQCKVAKYVVVSIPTRWCDTKKDALAAYIHPHTPSSFKAMCRKAGLEITTFLAFGDPDGPTFTVLRKILPYVVWCVLRRRLFAATVAAICTSKGDEE